MRGRGCWGMRWLAGSRDFRGALHAFVTGKEKGCPNRSMAGDSDEAPSKPPPANRVLETPCDHGPSRQRLIGGRPSSRASTTARVTSTECNMPRPRRHLVNSDCLNTDNINMIAQSFLVVGFATCSTCAPNAKTAASGATTAPR